MNDTIEDDVRAAFQRVTDPVVPRPDPLGRLLVRRRRRGWRRGAGAAVAAVVLAVTGGTLAAAPLGSPIGPSPGPVHTVVGPDGGTDPGTPKSRMNDWTRRLIDSPTRGNLAGDTELVAAVTREAERGSLLTPAPAGQDRVKVLAIAEVSGARIAVIALYGDEFATVQLTHAPSDGSPADLASGTLGGGVLGLRPLFEYTGGVHEGSDKVEHMTSIALAPAGCSIDSSETTTIDSEGTAHRTWTPHGDHLIVAGDLGRAWWRVNCDGRVRFEGTSYLGGFPPVPDAPTPLRGSADRGLVGSAVGAWTFATRHLGGSTPTVLWAGPVGGDQTAVVVAGPGRDGRTLVTASTGEPSEATRAAAAAIYYDGSEPYIQEPSPEPLKRQVIAVPYGTATAASSGMVVVRLPASKVTDFRPVLGSRILVIAPPTATRVVAAEIDTPLVDGVGITHAGGGGSRVTFTALDAKGAVVATAKYSEPEGTGQFFGERIVDDWR